MWGNQVQVTFSFFSCGFCVLYTILLCPTKSIIPEEIFKSDKKLIWTP